MSMTREITYLFLCQCIDPIFVMVLSRYLGLLITLSFVYQFGFSKVHLSNSRWMNLALHSYLCIADFYFR